jgi:hypothetical protein
MDLEGFPERYYLGTEHWRVYGKVNVGVKFTL